MAAGATLSALSIWLSVLAYGSFSASSDARIAFLAATGIAAAMAAAVATVRGMSRAHTRGLTAVGAVVALMTAATIVSEVVIAAAYLVLSR